MGIGLEGPVEEMGRKYWLKASHVRRRYLTVVFRLRLSLQKTAGRPEWRRDNLTSAIALNTIQNGHTLNVRLKSRGFSSSALLPRVRIQVLVWKYLYGVRSDKVINDAGT